MTAFLCKLFIKNYDNPEDATVRKKYGTLASTTGIIMNIILSVFKLIVGILTASVAITADALNNFSDAGASAISLISFKLSAKPADRDHPFGHARIEYIASMIVSFLILLVGAELLMDASKTLLGLSEASEPVISLVSIIILTASILVKLWLALFYRKIGKKINSGVILAASTDSLTDCISTASALASTIIIKYTGFEKTDAIVGILISILIIIAGIKILNETKNSLLGEAPTEEMLKEIKAIVAKEPAVIGMHDMIIHNYGPSKFFASFHAEVNGTEDIYLLHDKIDNLEKKLQQELNISCTIHLDPIVLDDEILNELKEFVKTEIAAINENLNIHDFRAVIGETHTNLIFDVEVPFEIPVQANELITKISESINNKRPDCFCVITIDRC